MGKTAFIDGWDRIGKPKDISDVDSPKVATEQYHVRHLVILGSA